MRERAYNREEAVEYALKYADGPNLDYHYFEVYGTDGGDCTNYVSQCLYAGGIPMAFEDQNDSWWYKRHHEKFDAHSWSLSWTHSHTLYWCLKKRYEANLPGLKGKEVEHIDDLELGDIIFYENDSYQINHSGIITGFYQGHPLISQHSPNLKNISYIKKNKTKMHYIKIIED